MEKFKEFITENKIVIEGGLFLLLFIIQIGMFCYFYIDNQDNSSLSNEVVVNTVEEDEEVVEEEPTYFYVDVKGEVNNPGTYKIEEGKRVIDAIEMAGNLTKNADTSANNLSLKVKDEMVIIIYSKDEIKDFTTIKEEEELLKENCTKEVNNLTNDTCIQSEEEKEENSTEEKTTLVSINTASKEELMTISGIGESKALAIIEYREENGLFKDISEIKNVSGIGDSLYEKIKDYITT